MVSIATIKSVLDRTEKRIIHRGRKAFKLIREELVRSYTLAVDESVLAGAFFVGMTISYIFGRILTRVKIDKKNKRKMKLRFEEPLPSIDYIFELILTQDRDILKNIIGVSVPSLKAFIQYFHPSEASLDFLESYSLELARIEAEDMKSYVKDLIVDTIEEGMSEEEAVEYLLENLKGFSERRIKAIARTEATRAFNIGTLEETFTDPTVLGYKFVAVLDQRTTKICRMRHGKFIPKDSPDLAYNTPPLHVNCRSVLEMVSVYDRQIPPMMPSEFPEDAQPLQRNYDIMVLQNLFSAWSR